MTDEVEEKSKNIGRKNDDDDDDDDDDDGWMIRRDEWIGGDMFNRVTTQPRITAR